MRYKHEMDAYILRKNARKLHQQEQEQRVVDSPYSDGEPFRPSKAARTIRYQVVPPLPGPSPFSNVMPPAPTYEGSQYPYAMNQPGTYYPQPYCHHYGMGLPQGSRGASVSAAQQYGTYGRDTMASSNAYAMRGEEYNYR